MFGLARLVAIGLIAALPVARGWADSLPRSILVLDQSSPGLAAYIEISDAFRSVLEKESPPPAVYEERLDLGRFSGPSYKHLLENYLRQKYRDVPIDLFVAIGARALDTAISLRNESWPEIPIVFTLVAEAGLRSPRPSNVTGQTIQISLKNSINAAQALVPSLKRIALVGDPLERQAFRSHFQSELSELTPHPQLVDLLGLPMRDLQKQVAMLSEGTAIIYTTVNVDGDGNIYTPRQALKEIAAVANRPIIIDVETFLGQGATGGFVLIPAAVGREAAHLVVRILRGEPVSNIPVSIADAVKPVFDWRAMQRWGITETQLPQGSEIRFRELTVWEQYRWRIVLIATAFLLQTALILGLWFEDRRRRAAEANGQLLMSELTHTSRMATAGQLTASIAHEIRQPLAAITASASAALNWLNNKVPDIDEVRVLLKNIVSEGHRADDVITNIRSMFRKDATPHTPININDLVQEIIPLTNRKLADNGIVLKTDLPDTPPPIVFADPVQLQQVILNLIVNAADAMSASASSEHVLLLKTRANQANVSLVVKDTGPGIDPKDMENIFKPFFTTKSSGMGMGLSICKSIVEAHAGTLTVSSNGRGTIFEMTFPCYHSERP